MPRGWLVMFLVCPWNGGHPHGRWVSGLWDPPRRNDKLESPSPSTRLLIVLWDLLPGQHWATFRLVGPRGLGSGEGTAYHTPFPGQPPLLLCAPARGRLLRMGPFLKGHLLGASLPSVVSRI